jgi:hypothetical protein
LLWGGLGPLELRLVASRGGLRREPGKRQGRAAKAADNRERQENIPDHGSLPHVDGSAPYPIPRRRTKRNHARDVGSFARFASSDARHRYQAAVERNGDHASPIAARSRGFGCSGNR